MAPSFAVGQVSTKENIHDLASSADLAGKRVFVRVSRSCSATGREPALPFPPALAVEVLSLWKSMRQLDGDVGCTALPWARFSSKLALLLRCLATPRLRHARRGHAISSDDQACLPTTVARTTIFRGVRAVCPRKSINRGGIRAFSFFSVD